MDVDPKDREAKASSSDSLESEEQPASKLETPLVGSGSLDRRYAVNWEDIAETDTQFLVRETKQWARRQRARLAFQHLGLHHGLGAFPEVVRVLLFLA